MYPHMILLHAGAPLEPHDLWAAWSFEPAVVGAVGILAVVYYRGSRVALSRTTRAGEALLVQRICFTLGLLMLVAALVSPLHELGGVLFSAHMIQHELLMTVAAPLLILGRPAVPLLWSLPRNFRKRLAIGMGSPPIRSSWRTVSSPPAAWLIHGVAIWVWHIPGLYDASVRSELVHSLQHYSFFATAMLFWWAILRADRNGIRDGIAVIALFTTAVHTSLLGALLTSAEPPIYTAYGSTDAWGLTQLEDQQLGGIVMWVPGGIPYAVAALVLFTRWMKESGRRAATGMRERAISLAPRGRSLVLLLAALTLGCGQRGDAVADFTRGHPERGRDAMRKYGCQSCHTIPGVIGARALVGPPLEGIAGRSFIGGVLTNSPENMMAWLRDPPAHAPRTAMPNLGVTEKDARDMTAYLYTLR